MKHLRSLVRGACALAATILLAACGGGGSASSAPGPQPGQIHGIATPSSISVVTATNAQ